MIDSAALVWGHQRGRQLADLIENPEAGRRARGPGDIDLREAFTFAELAAVLGEAPGEIQTRRYVNRDAETHYGHWQLEHAGATVDVLATSAGRLELRASLPKLIHGRNDIVLTALETRLALELLAALARRLTGVAELTLENARLARADYCYQWVVPSVKRLLDALAVAWCPARRTRAEFHGAGALGGRSLVYGYGSPTVYRFYDKAAERAAAGDLVPDAQIDRLLRFEVQQRRPLALESQRAGAYNAERMLLELRRAFDVRPMVTIDPLEQAETEGEVLRALAGRAIAADPTLLAELGRRVSKTSYYRYRRAAAAVAGSQLATAEQWEPHFPDDLGESGMEPSRDPAFGATYPSSAEVAEHAEQLERKRAAVIARARERSEQLHREQTRYPTPDELDRARRENRYARYVRESDQLVSVLMAERRIAADRAYAKLLGLEQERDRRHRQLELGEYLADARGSLAREIAASGALPASWPEP